MKKRKRGDVNRTACSETYKAVLAANNVSEASLVIVGPKIIKIDDLEFIDLEHLMFVKGHIIGCPDCLQVFNNGLLDRLLKRSKGCLKKSERHS